MTNRRDELLQQLIKLPNTHANWFAPPAMKAVGYAVRTFKGLQWYAQRTLLGYPTFMATR